MPIVHLPRPVLSGAQGASRVAGAALAALACLLTAVTTHARSLAKGDVMRLRTRYP